MAEAETAASSSKAHNEQGFRHEWPDWYLALAKYKDSSAGKSIWQLMNTVIPYFLLWALMILSIKHGYSYMVTLALAVIAAALLVRIFILFHDCVHGSLFKKKGPNTFFGHSLGLMVFTPFDDWRFSHLRHHATYADLDARGFGDIWTMTLAEYKDARGWKRISYRLYRNPLVLVGLGAIFCFLLRYRLPARKSARKERVSVIFTNLVIVCIVMAASWSIGWQTYLLIQLPVIWMAGAAGVWLFFVQHQFDGVYWSRKKDWDALRAAMEGSSFYKLPAVLRWLSGSIGYHHVHHLGPRIPNYRLKECYDAVPALQARTPLTFWESLSSASFKVWDEDNRKLVGFP